MGCTRRVSIRGSGAPRSRSRAPSACTSRRAVSGRTGWLAGVPTSSGCCRGCGSAFPGPFDEVDAAGLERAANRVERSLIRIEADEVTYNLHILIRFELELEIFEGGLPLADLPEAWNARYRDYLGLEVPDDAHGVLQDVHWAGGAFGYFPTYSLGNIIAGQLWEAAGRDLGDLPARIGEGDLAALGEWLRDKVHRHGRRLSPAEILERAGCGELSVEPLLRTPAGARGTGRSGLNDGQSAVHIKPQFAGMLGRRMAVGPSRNGVYGGWTHAGNSRVFVRVPTELKELSRSWNVFHGNGGPPELGVTPIVLVHGLSSSRTLKPLIRALGSRRPVYAPDLPGFGMSDQPIHALDIPGLADALQRWQLKNQLAPAIVIGVSFGCHVAVDLAARHPAAVDRLVLVGPTFDPEARTPGAPSAALGAQLPRAPLPACRRRSCTTSSTPGRGGPCATLRRALEDPIEDKLGDIEAPDPGGPARARPPLPGQWTERVAELIPERRARRAAEGRPRDRAAHAARLTTLLAPFVAEQ